MAIRDLLWACPICGGESSLAPTRNGEVCRRCATHFARDGRALITARRPGHTPLTLTPAEWVDRLPDLRIEERLARAAAQGGVIRSEPALLRTEIGSQPVYFRGAYLNRIERLGPPRTGELRLEVGRLVFTQQEEEPETTAHQPVPLDRADAAASGAAARMLIWDFNAITAVQPSSSTLQINARGVPLASLQVPGGSIRLWEELICAALRHHYRTTGRGEIVEFQPRLTTNRAP